MRARLLVGDRQLIGVQTGPDQASQQLRSQLQLLTVSCHPRRNGISPQLQALEDAVQNKLEWRYEMRREAQEILPGKLSML